VKLFSRAATIKGVSPRERISMLAPASSSFSMISRVVAGFVPSFINAKISGRLAGHIGMVDIGAELDKPINGFNLMMINGRVKERTSFRKRVDADTVVHQQRDNRVMVINERFFQHLICGYGAFREKQLDKRFRTLHAGIGEDRDLLHVIFRMRDEAVRIGAVMNQDFDQLDIVVLAGTEQRFDKIQPCEAKPGERGNRVCPQFSNRTDWGEGRRR
jgi:hypothetical protein